jgi:hypothetical protein
MSLQRWRVFMNKMEQHDGGAYVRYDAVEPCLDWLWRERERLKNRAQFSSFESITRRIAELSALLQGYQPRGTT